MRQLRFVYFALLIAVILGSAGQAEAFVELNAFYFNDAMTAGTNATNNRMNIEVSVGFAVDKKNQYLVGWNYSMMNATDTTTATQTYASTQMGPRFIYSIDKANAWTIGLGYYLVTNASYDDGAGGSFKWKGTALKADFGYNFPAGENLLLGMRFNYSSASYTEQLIGSTTYSTIGYTKVSMYPSLYAIYLF